jgi:hypothetical protein
MFYTVIVPYARKIIYGAIVISLIFSLGYEFGTKESIKEANKKKIEEISIVQTKTNDIQSISDKSSIITEVAKTENKIVYKTIYKEVIKYEKTNPAANAYIDHEFGMLFNASSLSCSITKPTCKSDAEIRQEVTNAELLRTINEQHEIYQLCRITVEGLQDFYKKVQTEVNDDNN